MPKRKKHKIITEKRKSLPLIVFLRRFYKPLAAAVSVVIFFLVYNTYIVDRSMLDIQFALEQTASAESLSDMQGLDMILGAAVLRELAPKELDSENLINLDFASSVTKTAEILTQTKDIEFMLSEVLKKKRNKRSSFLVILDQMNEKVIKASDGIKATLFGVKAMELVVVEPDEKAIARAKEFEAKGDSENAIRAYEGALKQVPQYQGIEKIHLGFLYQRIGNFNKAKIIYEQVINNASDSQIAYFARRLFDNLKNLKRLAEKKKLLEENILKEFQTEKLQELYYELATTKGLLGDLQGADEAYQKVIELTPKADLAQKAKFNLGFIYKIQSKPIESEKIFRQLSEESAQSELGIGSHYWIADSLRDQGKYEEALEKFQEVAERFKDKPVANASLFRAGYTSMYELKDPQRAKMFFDRLRQRASQADITNYAIEKVQSDISSVYTDEGFKLILQGKLEEAMVKFEDAIKLNSADAFAHGGLGAAKGLAQLLQEALQNAKKAVELAPQDGYTNANLGFIYILQDDYSEALKSYEKAVKFKPAYAEAQYNLGWLYQKQKQFNKAIEAYKQSIKHNPKLAVAHNNLGICYWHMDRLHDASGKFVRAVQLDEGLPEAHYNLGIMHLLLGRLPQAEAEMLKAQELTSDIPQIQNILSTIRQKMKKFPH